MTAQHTQGRLAYRVRQLGTSPYADLRRADDMDGDRRGLRAVAAAAEIEDARRLAACWNMLRGFSTEQIEASEVDLVALAAERDQLRAELDEARALLTAKYDLPPGDSPAAVAVVAERLTRLSTFLGVVLTITQRPLLPLAMRNYETVVDVRPARGDS